MKTKIFIISFMILLIGSFAYGGTYGDMPSGGGSSSGSSTKLEVDAHASGNITAAQMSFAAWHNVGQVADSAQSMADFATGMNFSVKPSVAVAKYLRLTPSATANFNNICPDGQSCCGAGKYFGLTTVLGTEALSCEARKTATGYDLYCSQLSGAWACEP